MMLFHRNGRDFVKKVREGQTSRLERSLKRDGSLSLNSPTENVIALDSPAPSLIVVVIFKNPAI